MDRTDAERDAIARVITVQRGVFSTEMQHIKKSTLVIHHRLTTPTVVYIRHAVAAGYHLVGGPANPDVVGLEEKRMLARIRFEDGVADLSLGAGAGEKTAGTGAVTGG